MLNQTFNPQELRKLVSDSEIAKFNLGYCDADIMSSITNISYKVSQEDFSFKLITKELRNNKEVYSVDNDGEYFAIKRLNHIIKRLYAVSYSNRNEILEQLIKILQDGSKYSVIRVDIKDFFGNVSRPKLVSKLNSDSLLGSLMVNKVKQLDKKLTSLKCKGLPRGISLSSTLSEIFLRDFDRTIKSHNDVYYYARYVDDIIIICLENLNDINDLVKGKLQDLDLSINDKYTILDGSVRNGSFDYLGVNFRFAQEKLILSLADKKIKKFKTRIIKAILDFGKNKDSSLLIDRIRFLTGNHFLFTKTESNNLKAGIYYNNQFIDNLQQLSELNEFLRKSFTSKKGSLSKTTRLIPSNVVSTCIRQCFFKGYINKRMVAFNSQRIREVMRCWKYE